MVLRPLVRSLIGIAVCVLSFSASASQLKISPAVDINPDPNVFETTITAKPMKMKVGDEKVTVFAYNGQVPGPEIRVKQGDRVIVHFKNQLPDGYPSTIHWHGIELNNASDGTPMTQDVVEPGDSFTYDFIVPRGGVYWYHPHVRGSQVVNAGLYGPLIVKEPFERDLVAAGVLPKRSKTLVLSDIALDDGELRNIEQTPMLETMNGTEGQHLLVNGKIFPTLKVRPGKPVRMRLINASISRYFRLALPGHTIYRVGGEGGLLANVRVEGGPVMGMRMSMDPDYSGHEGMVMIDQGYAKGELLLAPAQRADIVIVPEGRKGERLTMEWKDFARGRHRMMATSMGMMMTEAEDDGLRPSIPLFELKLRGKRRWHRYSIEEGQALAPNAGRLLAERTDTQIKLQADMMAMMKMKPKQTWFKIDGFSGVEKRENFRTASIGEAIEWETHNHTDMHHPFHLHGFSFQPLMFSKMNHEEGYMDMWEVNPENEFMDTINVPPHTSVFYAFEVGQRPDYGAVAGTSVGDGALGDWVFHCHIFQHGENGMMSFLRVRQ